MKREYYLKCSNGILLKSFSRLILVGKYRSIAGPRRQYRDKDLINYINFAIDPEIQIFHEVNNNTLKNQRSNLVFTVDFNDPINSPPKKGIAGNLRNILVVQLMLQKYLMLKFRL